VRGERILGDIELCVTGLASEELPRTVHYEVVEVNPLGRNGESHGPIIQATGESEVELHARYPIC
jgi:hypothetical protein